MTLTTRRHQYHRPSLSSTTATPNSKQEPFPNRSLPRNAVSIKSKLIVFSILTLIGIQATFLLLQGAYFHDDTMLEVPPPQEQERQGQQQRPCEKNHSLLDMYNPSHYPVMPLSSLLPAIKSSSNIKLQISKRPITVGIVTILPLSGEAKHFLFDGVQLSQYLQLVSIVSLYDSREDAQRNDKKDVHRGEMRATKSLRSPTTNINTNENTSIPSYPPMTAAVLTTTAANFSNQNFVDPSIAQLWLVDGQRVAKLKNRQQFLMNLLHPTNPKNTDTMISQNPFQYQPGHPSWKVLIIDYTDTFQFQIRHYNRLNIWDQNIKHVRLAIRSIVRGRFFDASTKTIYPGRIMDDSNSRNTTGNAGMPKRTASGPILHCPYAVRTDIVETVRGVLLATQQQEPRQKPEDNITTIGVPFLVPSFEGANRPLDVLHLWNISSKEGKSQLRNAVSRAVKSWDGSTRASMPSSSSSLSNFTTTKTTIKTSITERGARRRIGRNTVQKEYVKAMLGSKIVIVTQKDSWEDHYRMFEALACGPLVITDYMLALPNGFENGTHLLMFHSIAELHHLVQYYLSRDTERVKIAERGYQIAMNQHRSHHRLEHLIFGAAITIPKT